MPWTGLWSRVFVGLLIAVMPPIVLIVAGVLITESMIRDADPTLVAIGLVVAATVWAALVAVVFARSLADDYRSVVALARRGVSDDDADGAYGALAALLGERNRQVATLAEQAAAIPIDDDPRAVVDSVVAAIRRVMADATWRCAVLTSNEPAILPPGVYAAAENGMSVGDVSELERWASVSEAEFPARYVEGPWGAFAVVDVSVADRVRGILYAPWEGRTPPNAAELNLLRLIGERARTSLEHALLYAQVRRQADELERLAAVQADFLRGVTHDLQTPLTSIGALATELRANVAVPASARADLESITHQADRLRRMVGQLLVASRLEAGVLTAEQEVFAVPPVIERVWAALRMDRPFALEVAGPPHLAIGDPNRLEQALWAILDNATKYSPAGSPIQVRVSADDGVISIGVTDRGMGMDEEVRRQAFDQFFRAPEARRAAPDGSGVGLYAARGLLRAMSGDMTIESRLGGGTTVTLSLPGEPSDATDE